MEGRRVSHRSQSYNPLFLLFLGMVAAVVVLLIVSVVLGAKLGKANKGLKAAQSQITELQQTVAQLEDDLAAARKGTSSVPPAPDADKNDAKTPAGTDNAPSNTESSWLNLSGHNEVKVKPTTLFDGYQTYYATANVNVRSGPGTSYDRIASVNYGGKVQVAAREGGWMFANVGSQFGWISADYLSTTQPPAQTTVTPVKPKTAEATSGSLTAR